MLLPIFTLKNPSNFFLSLIHNVVGHLLAFMAFCLEYKEEKRYSAGGTHGGQLNHMMRDPLFWPELRAHNREKNEQVY